MDRLMKQGAKKNDKTEDYDEDYIPDKVEGQPLFKKIEKKEDCAFCLRRNVEVVLVLENCGHSYCPHCLL